jgi:hypothetical protein
MPAPTITSLTPSSGLTGGRTLVEALGSGFRPPSPPPPSGPTPPPKPSVQVLVGGREATEVRVRADDRLTFLTPAGDAGPVDVVVRNIDDDGAPFAGEEATLPGAFTYRMPALTAESDLARLVRTLLRELKRQVLPNVSLTVQTDFDAQTGDELHIAELASLPALVLVGPELREDRFYSLNQLPEVAGDAGTFLRRRVPYTVDLAFTIVGASDHTVELLNLMAATELFFHKNKFLEMARNPANAGAGRVRYEMDFAPDGDLRVTSQPNESNVRSFSGSFVIRGFDLEDVAGAFGEGATELTAPAGEIVIGTPEQLTTVKSLAGGIPVGEERTCP